jgi:hypothetical protein
MTWRGDNAVPYRLLDYDRLIAWLRAIVATDPRSGYALFSAARVYTENPDASKCRAMLEFLYAEFGRDPDRRWPWLAHCRARREAPTQRSAASTSLCASDRPAGSRSARAFMGDADGSLHPGGA